MHMHIPHEEAIFVSSPLLQNCSCIYVRTPSACAGTLTDTPLSDIKIDVKAANLAFDSCELAIWMMQIVISTRIMVIKIQ